MTKTTARSYLLMLAIAVITTAALLVWGFAATPAYADEPTDIDKIVFDGDDSYDWVHIYAVEGQLGSWDVDQLNIEIRNRAGDPIDPNDYDLSFEYVYYDENQGFDVKEPTDGPFGINERDQEQGFSEYQVKATPKSTSEIGGEAEANFMIADKHSLNYICPEITFENYAEKDDWRMHDRYWYTPGKDISYLVKDCAGNLLAAGIDYDITYYYRTGSPEDMDDPNKGFEDILVANEENMVKDGEGNPVAPTEPGAYFARIEGIDPYYGGNDVLIDITDNIPIIVKEIKLEKTEECDLWSDEMLTYDVVLPEGAEGAPLRFIVGVRGEADWDVCFADRENESDYFVYDGDTKTLKLYGKKIFDEIGERYLNIYVNAKNQDNEVIAEGFADVDVRESICDYGLPEDDNILPEWDGWIDKKLNVWVQNKDNPEGRDFECEVTDLNIVSENGDLVLKIDEDEKGWNYRGIDIGTARLQMTYTDINGDEKTHEFDVNVSETVYYADVWAPEGVYQGLPGTEIDLEASAEKHTAIRDGDGWRHDSTSDGLNLSWSFEDPDSTRFAEMEVSDDPAKATVCFKDIDEEWIDERIGVRVGVTDEESTPSIERASNRTDLFMRSEYYQIWPATIDSSLDVGKVTTIEPEVRFYRYGQSGHSAVEDPRFTVEDFDPEAVVIDYDAHDNLLHIIRKADGDTNFNIRADFDTDDGNESIDQWYHLDRKNYRIDFEYGDEDIYSDQDLTVKLNKEDLEGLTEDLKDLDNEDYQITYTVGIWNDVDEGFAATIEPGDGENWNYKADIDGISINGANMKKAFEDAKEAAGPDFEDRDGINIRAQLKVAGNDYEDAWFWCGFRESCTDRGEEHKWTEWTTLLEPTLTSEGMRFRVCADHPAIGGCGEVEIEAIPKKVDIADATVTVKNVTYNKKAQTPALTVEYSGAVLKAGIDYTAAYKNNTNAGKATVTVTGNGKYAGTNTATFTIAKAANPIKLTAKKATVKFTKVKKKNQTVKQAKACTVSGAQGKVTWKKASGNAKITVATNGNITVKKGLKKGTYKVKVNATAAGNANYNKATKATTIKVVVK